MINSSKKRFTWKFNIDGSDFTIELFHSGLSGRRKVTLNGVTKHDESSYNFPIRFIDMGNFSFLLS